MTRINVGIPVERLSDRHLLAEHREIKRLPNHLAKHGANSLKNAPKEFTLGPGHVKFFLDKGRYTFKRYLEIRNECFKRGFNITDFGFAWEIYNRYESLYQDYTPTERDINLITERINQRGGFKL